MRIEVLLFAAIRDAAQADRLTIDVGNDARAADIIAVVAEKLPAVAALLPSCRVAIDACYVDADAVISPNCEVALIPPVSGG